MSPTWKAAIGIILVFILGWFGGVVMTMVIARHKALALAQRDPEAVTIVLERQTTRNLDLNADQKAHLHALILENIKQRLELQKQIQPQVKAVNRQTLQEIDAVLTPDQQQRFRENLTLFKSRFGRNPFYGGTDDKSPTPAEQPSFPPVNPESASTNAAWPTTSASPEAK